MIHLRNNLRLIAYHLILLALIAAAGFVLWRTGVELFHMIGWFPVVLVPGSFVIGLMLDPPPKAAGSPLSTLSLLAVSLLIWAVCAVSDLALDAVYMYGLFHLPYGLLPLVDSFQAANVLVVTLPPFLAATLGIFIKRRLVR
jgi:hypothetical protein